MKKEYITPILIRMEVAEKYQKSSIFGKKGTPWAIDYLVTIGDKGTVSEIKKKRWLGRAWSKMFPSGVNTDGSLGYEFYFFVCSPEYAKRPFGKETGEYIRSALIQDIFDEDKAKTYLMQKLESVGPQSPNNLGKELAYFLDTHDWDHNM